jgi:putative two-component system response regulator
MRLHVHYGQAMLLDAGSALGRIAAAVALHHHEKFDGSGYPFALRGSAIPLYARIAAVADVFDALTSRRPQRCALGFDFALEYVRRQGGMHFDPECVAAFVAEERRILEIRRRFPDYSDEVEERQPGHAQV